MPMTPRIVEARVTTELLPAFLAERERLDRIDGWYRWDPDKPYMPRQSTQEYRELQARSPTTWLGLVVTSVAQALYVDGFRRASSSDDHGSWQWWQANRLDARQVAVHRAALAYGLAYATVLPGVHTFTDEPMPVIRGVSPRNMIAFYLDPGADEWPTIALRAEPAQIDGATGWSLRVYDDEAVYRLQADGAGTGVRFVTYDEHDAGVCPVVRFSNQLDLEGRADGEVEPFIPVAARINQTVFDRLVVQRFSSWAVRTIAGMARPDKQSDADAEKLRLKVEDILVAEDPDTKFGSLPATSLDGFIAAAKADIMALAAVSQTPAHELLGQMANLSAEALAAARASLTAKVSERQAAFGESWEQALRLASWVMGDREGALDQAAQVRWRDTEIRSLSQAADALGKIAQMLGFPVEMLWEKVPGMSQQDVERAKALVQERDGLAALFEQLSGGFETAGEFDAPGVGVVSGVNGNGVGGVG